MWSRQTIFLRHRPNGLFVKWPNGSCGMLCVQSYENRRRGDFPRNSFIPFSLLWLVRFYFHLAWGEGSLHMDALLLNGCNSRCTHMANFAHGQPKVHWHESCDYHSFLPLLGLQNKVHTQPRPTHFTLPLKGVETRDHFLKELLKGEFLFSAWHCYDWLFRGTV